jgi:putative holliday junction resolvase
MTGYIIGLDVGDKRVGIALSDAGRLIAQPHSVYTRVGFGPDVKHIAGLCAQFHTLEVVCGFPRSMDGSVGPQARKVQELADKLTQAGLNVVFEDERLSTVSAEQALIAGGMRRENRRQTVDKVAAAIILQQYLDRCNKIREENNHMTNEQKDSLPEEESNIVELTDENGETTQFEYVTTINHESNSYVVLMLAQDEECEQEESDEGEVIILKIEKDPKTDEDIYVSVDDDAVVDAVFEKFTKFVEEEDASFSEEE